MIAVSSIMSGLAEHLGENQVLWEAIGLLHDIDYETIEDFNTHGVVSAEIVADILPEKALHAIRAHNPRTGVRPNSKVAIALIAADALSGLLVATALMMPDKKLATVRRESIKRKYKDHSFARGVNRENIDRCKELGLSLQEFFALGLKSMQTVSHELGL
jgi:putative nucleotidyltransferase with HDIG domain